MSKPPRAKPVSKRPRAKAAESPPPSALNSAAIQSLAAAAKRSAGNSVTAPRPISGHERGAAAPSMPPRATAWALAPAREVQQQQWTVLEHFARAQYAFVGDCLELGLTQLSAGLAAHTPVEFTLASAAIASQFNARQQTRWREWLALSTAGQQSLQQLWSRTATRVVESVQRVI